MMQARQKEAAKLAAEARKTAFEAAKKEAAEKEVMKTSTLLMHLYQYKYQFLVPLLALVLVNSTIR
jgi:hypothetical protein